MIALPGSIIPCVVTKNNLASLRADVNNCPKGFPEPFSLGKGKLFNKFWPAASGELLLLVCPLLPWIFKGFKKSVMPAPGNNNLNV